MSSEKSQLLNTLTINTLKNILRDAKLPVSGSKSALILRLLKNIEHPSIVTFFNTCSSCPTSIPTSIKTPIPTSISTSIPTSIKTHIQSNVDSDDDINNNTNSSRLVSDMIIVNTIQKKEDRLEVMYKILEDISDAHKHIIRILIDNKSDSVSIMTPIENDDLELFYKAFLLNTSVKKLHVSNRNISMDIMEMIKNILLLNKLTDLTISLSSTIGYSVACIVPLKDGLMQTSSLINLKLMMLLDDAKLYSLKHGIIANKSIISLDLSSNLIKCEGSATDAICDILTHNNTLKVLNLSGNDMSSSRSFVSDNPQPNLLLNAFRANSSLRELKLSGNNIKPFNLRILLRGIALSNIDTLDIGSNDMETSTWNYLNSMCDKNNNIHRLILSGNIISMQEFTVLCNTIIERKNIVELNIQNCIFDIISSNIVAKLIAADFIENLNISNLKIISNREQRMFMDDVAYTLVRFKDDMSLIIDALKSNTTLKQLHISGMIISPYVPSFLKVVRDIPTLSILDISNNEIREYGYLVADILVDDKLNGLNMMYTNLSDESIQVIIDGVNSTTGLVGMKTDIPNGKSNKIIEKVSINSENHKHRYQTLLGILIDELSEYPLKRPPQNTY